MAYQKTKRSRFPAAPVAPLPEPQVRLYLDDERALPHGWTAAKTAQEAIEILKKENVSEVSLDHDLGPPEAGNGYQVLCWIEEKVHTDPKYKLPKVYIHTANPSAKIKMLQTLHSIEQKWWCRDES